MSRNLNRLGPQSGPANDQEEQVVTPQPVNPGPNPFGVSFVVPSEIVHLPSKGLFYDKGVICTESTRSK